jgi:alkylation response protein AidB-like acyl-CoA dehydrogenase
MVLLMTQTADLTTFRAEVRAFLAESLTSELARAGRRATSVFAHPDHSIPWQKILTAKGWGAMDWPVEYGGTGWSAMQKYIFAAESTRAGAPSLLPQGLKMVAPVLMHYGSDEQKAYFLPRILSGEHYWCQGFSEPGSGSDLASLKLKAITMCSTGQRSGPPMRTLPTGCLRWSERHPKANLKRGLALSLSTWPPPD